MKDTIQSLLTKLLPNAFVTVEERTHFFGGSYIKIRIAASDYEINNVKGQHPALVSLSLDLNTLDLVPQCFGGCGGQHIYRKPRKDDPSEQYLALKGIKIPFRKPKAEEKHVLAAIERFALNWKKAVQENIDEMPYPEVDFSKAIL